MKKIYLLMAIAVLVLSCGNESVTDYSLEYQSLSGLDLRAIIAKANEWRAGKPEITSYVTSNEVIIKFPDGKEKRAAMLADTIFIAIAPYINYTHPCDNHYFSSCSAELKQKKIKVIAKDENASIVVNKDFTTLSNGFFELWLPAGRIYNVHLEYENYSTDEAVSTKPGCRTCITTAKLK